MINDGTVIVKTEETTRVIVIQPSYEPTYDSYLV